MQKINFITLIVFEILKLKYPVIWLAKIIFAFNHAHLKFHDQFVTLIDMKLHAQNQYYTSFSFWDLKVLIASLDMPGYPWPCPRKITSSICSFNRYAPACKKINFISQLVFEILKFRNPPIWLAESIFAFNLRTRLFPDMQF